MLMWSLPSCWNTRPSSNQRRIPPLVLGPPPSLSLSLHFVSQLPSFFYISRFRLSAVVPSVYNWVLIALILKKKASKQIPLLTLLPHLSTLLSSKIKLFEWAVLTLSVFLFPINTSDHVNSKCNFIPPLMSLKCIHLALSADLPINCISTWLFDNHLTLYISRHNSPHSKHVPHSLFPLSKELRAVYPFNQFKNLS